MAIDNLCHLPQKYARTRTKKKIKEKEKLIYPSVFFERLERCSENTCSHNSDGAASEAVRHTV
jgi:hypothetical protein